MSSPPSHRARHRRPACAHLRHRRLPPDARGPQQEILEQSTPATSGSSSAPASSSAAGRPRRDRPDHVGRPRRARRWPRRRRRQADRLRDRRDGHPLSRPRPSRPRSPTSSAPTRPRRSTSRRPAPASATASRWPRTGARGQRGLRAGHRRRAALRPHRPGRPRHGVPLRRRRRRGDRRPERHPGHRPGRLGFRRRPVRPDPAARGLARRDRLRPPEMPHLAMEGNPVFRWASFVMAKVAQQALDRAGISADDLDCFVPHQANMRIIDSMARAMKLPEHRQGRPRHRDQGNTSAASIPLAMERLFARATPSPATPRWSSPSGRGWPTPPRSSPCPDPRPSPQTRSGDNPHRKRHARWQPPRRSSPTSPRS